MSILVSNKQLAILQTVAQRSLQPDATATIRLVCSLMGTRQAGTQIRGQGCTNPQPTAHPALHSGTASLTVSACLNSGDIFRSIGVLPFCKSRSPHKALSLLIDPSLHQHMHWAGSPCPSCSHQPQPQSTAPPTPAKHPSPW